MITIRAAGMVLNMVGTAKPLSLLNRLSYRTLTYSFGPDPKIWWGPVPMSPYIPAGLKWEKEALKNAPIRYKTVL